MDLIIRGGTLVFDGIEMVADLCVSGGKIAGIGRDLPIEAEQTVDATDCLVLPGMVDVDSLFDQTLAGKPPEDLAATASRAAALGGFTTHCVDYPASEGPEAVRGAFGAGALSDFVARAAVDKRDGGSSRRKASDAARSGDSAGARMSLRALGTLMAAQPDDEVYTLFRETGNTRCVFANPQHGSLGDAALAAAGRAGGSPADLRNATHPTHLGRAGLRLLSSLLENADANVVALPITCSPELDALLEARDRLGAGMMAATSLPYLLFFSDDSGNAPEGRLPAGYPPPRRKADTINLWKAIESGLVDAIASGASAPDDSLLGNPLYALPALYGQGVMARRASLPALVSALCDNPAKMLSIYPRKGTLQIGSDADIVVFDPNGNTVAPEGSPYAKVKMAGSVEIVLRRGEVLADGGQLVEGAGKGEEIKPESVELKK